MTCTIILCVCVYEVTCHVQLFATLWTLVCQALLSMGFSRQVYWSRLPFPSPGDLPKLAVTNKLLELGQGVQVLKIA